MPAKHQVALSDKKGASLMGASFRFSLSWGNMVPVGA